MCAFVKDCVSDFRLGVQETELFAEGDRPTAVHTKAEPTHRPVELKVPTGQTVIGHQSVGEGFGVFEDRRLLLLAVVFFRLA
jgi:hypothetical protein